MDTRHLLVYLSWETVRRWKQDTICRRRYSIPICD
jgi:hypothetical protein